MASPNPTPSGNKHITVEPTTIHVGAEVKGVDLREPMSEAVKAEIWAAFLQWKVLYFRDQNLDHAQHVAFARALGEPTIGHAVFGHVEGFPEVYSVAKHRKKNRYNGPSLVRPWSGWHADITAAVNPPSVSILRGVTIPPYGGDTMWTNLAAAYNGLSETMRGFLDGLRGIHEFGQPTGSKSTAAYNEQLQTNRFVTEHPLVRVHPETGERVLYVSPSFLKSIVGLSPRENQQMLELLWEHAVRPEYTFRYKWAAGDILMWDNRSTAHLAPNDIFEIDHDRQLYRVTLVGDVPVGVDGQSSKAIEGKPILGVVAA